MKDIYQVVIAIVLIFTSNSLISKETTPEYANRSYLMFTVIMSSGGSTRCPSEHSITLINTAAELRSAFKNLYACTKRVDAGIAPPELDLKTGSAVLLDMGHRGSMGSYIAALHIMKRSGNYSLTYVTLGREGCWSPALGQRPFQLIYLEEKIESLDTHHIEGYQSCDERRSEKEP